MGGLGLRAAEDQAPAANAASILSSQLLLQDLVGPRGPPRLAVALPGVDVDEPRPTLSPRLLAALSAAQGEAATAADLAGMTQRQMSVKIDLHQQQLLLEQVDQGNERERARLASLSLRHAGDWLNTPSLTALGLHLRAAEVVLVVKYRLGLPVFNTEGRGALSSLPTAK